VALKENLKLLVGFLFIAMIIRIVAWIVFTDNVDAIKFNYTFSLTQFDSILTGVLLALSIRYNVIGDFLGKLNNFKFFLIVTFIWLTLIIWMISSSALLTYTIGLTVINLFWAWIILFMVKSKSFFEHPSLTLFARMGKNGYCLYLVHHLALIVVYNFLPVDANLSDFYGFLLYLFRLLCAFIVALIMAEILFSLTEKPLLALRSSFRPVYR